MAKKKSPSKSAAAKSRRKPPQKPAKKPRHDHHADDHVHDETCGHVEIELDDTEYAAVEMVLGSQKLQHALEAEVSTALAGTVRKFCRQHGSPLTADQALNVAMVLFGEE
jgi:hypothetical protein